MNSIITLPKLTELLAQTATVNLKTAQSFISDLTLIIGEALKTDGTVYIKGLGTFNKLLKDDKIKVEFIPDKDISEAINAPFLFFEPVELADSISEEHFVEVGKADVLSEVEEVIDNAPSTDYDQPAEILAIEDSKELEQDDNKQDEIEISESIESTEAANSVEPTLMQPITEEEVEPEEVEDEKIEVEDDNLEVSSVAEETNSLPNEADDNEISEAQEDIEVNSHEFQPQNEFSENEEVSNLIEDSTEKELEEVPQPENTNSPENTIPYEEEEYEDEDSMKFPWFTTSLFAIVGLLVGLGLGYFGHDYIRGRASNISFGNDPELEAVLVDSADDDNEQVSSDTLGIDLSEATEDIVDQPVEKEVTEAKPEEVVKPSESVQEPQTTKEEEPVYDVVKPGSDLISLSLKHYKNKEYWIYIYDANKDKIKNPNNVQSGLRLVIPPKSQCDVSTDEVKNIEVAKQKSAQILGQFRNKK